MCWTASPITPSHGSISCCPGIGKAPIKQSPPDRQLTAVLAGCLLLDLRVMLAIGFGLFAYSMYLTATLTNQTGFWELFVPLAVRGLGLICCYLPANMIAMGTLPTRPVSTI